MLPRFCRAYFLKSASPQLVSKSKREHKHIRHVVPTHTSGRRTHTAYIKHHWNSETIYLDSSSLPRRSCSWLQDPVGTLSPQHQSLSCTADICTFQPLHLRKSSIRIFLIWQDHLLWVLCKLPRSIYTDRFKHLGGPLDCAAPVPPPTISAPDLFLVLRERTTFSSIRK